VIEVFSWSRLQTYKRCPARYAFSYLEQRAPECETLESVLGKLVHEVLAAELYVRDNASFYSAWDARRASLPRIRVVKPDTDVDAEVRAALVMILTGFEQIRLVHEEEHAETVAVEQEVEGELDGVPFVGHIDWLTRDEKDVQIRDWKTSRKTSRQATVDADGQLALYQILLERIHCTTLHWHFLRSDTIRDSWRSPAQLERLAEELAYRAREITAAREFPYNPSPLCGWCEFRGSCPASAYFGEDPETGLLTP